MNILFWTFQAVLALLCVSGGAFQIFKIEELQKGVAAMRELPQGLWAVFGAVNVLAGLGLILPAALKVAPSLTPISALVVAVESAIISALYIYYGDRPPLSYSVAMTVLAAFVAYGRLVLQPLSA